MSRRGSSATEGAARPPLRVSERLAAAAPRVRAWRPEACPGLELKRGVAGAEAVAPHLHDGSYQLTLVAAGASVFRCRRADHAVPAGRAMVIPPGEVHANRSTGARAFRSAYVAADLAARLLGGVDVEAAGPVARRPEALAAFLDAANGGAPPLALEGLLADALRLLLPAGGGVPAGEGRAVAGEHRAVARAKEIIRGPHGDGTSLRSLGTATGLHPNYLLNVFTREVGLSPHRYLASVRVERAKALLRRGRPLAEVALAAGFSDQSHLARAFKRHTLLTPGRYRAGTVGPGHRL